MLRQISMAIAAVASLLSFTTTAEAQYYEDKQITVLVNYGAGGTTDILARMIAKHMGKHIAGNPDLIVKNMPGAGGITATNHMGNVVDADGLTLAIFAVPAMQKVLSDPALSVELSDFVWLGGTGLPTTCVIRKDAGGGISKVDDFQTVGTFNLAGYRNTSSTDIRMRLGLDILGVEYNYVPGYRSASKVNAAILQNEGQFSCGSIIALRNLFEPNLIEPGLAIPLWYFAVVDSDGNDVNDPRLAGIPTFSEVFEKFNGEPPSGIQYDALTLINNTMVTMLWGSFVPKGTPDEAVASLRMAWDSLSSDPEFIAEFEAMTSGPPILTNASQVQENIQKLVDLNPELVKSVSDLISEE